MSICRSHFGQNYAGARDNFIYVYSQDNDSAYKQADRMVLARISYNAALKRLLGRRLLFRAEGPTERRAVTAVL